MIITMIKSRSISNFHSIVLIIAEYDLNLTHLISDRNAVKCGLTFWIYYNWESNGVAIVFLFHLLTILECVWCDVINYWTEERKKYRHTVLMNNQLISTANIENSSNNKQQQQRRKHPILWTLILDYMLPLFINIMMKKRSRKLYQNNINTATHEL